MNLNRIRAAIDREILARRVKASLIRAAVKPAPLTSPNQRHAAAAVLRSARLTAVGNSIATMLQQRGQELEKAVAGIIRTAWNSTPDQKGVINQVAEAATQAFDWMKGELDDDLTELQSILLKHTSAAVASHFGASGEIPISNKDALPDVLGAPPADHLDKICSDLIFRLSAAIRQSHAAGDTAAECVKRLGLDESVKASENPLSAINIGIRLFDTTDNSLLKFIQAAVVSLATAADSEVGDDMDDEEANMGFTWVSAADAKVCEYCEYMDGGKWDREKEPIGDSPELEQEPPAHLGCRCALLPCDLDEELPQGDFKSYLAHFSDQEQTAAFGKENIAAYRRGEMTPAALMGQQSHDMSLESFREMEPRLDLDVTKYGKMGEQSGAVANLETIARRIKSVMVKTPRVVRAREGDLPVSLKAIITDSEGRVLILKDAHSDWHDLPGGHLREGETIEEGLRREVKEETGLELKSCEPHIIPVTLVLGGKKTLVVFYDCKQEEGSPVMSEEHSDFFYVEPDKLSEYNLGVFLPVLKELEAAHA